jgi:hypothetical protein
MTKGNASLDSYFCRSPSYFLFSKCILLVTVPLLGFPFSSCMMMVVPSFCIRATTKCDPVIYRHMAATSIYLSKRRKRKYTKPVLYIQLGCQEAAEDRPPPSFWEFCLNFFLMHSQLPRTRSASTRALLLGVQRIKLI